jgi:hypothetical protein
VAKNPADRHPRSAHLNSLGELVRPRIRQLPDGFQKTRRLSSIFVRGGVAVQQPVRMSFIDSQHFPIRVSSVFIRGQKSDFQHFPIRVSSVLIRGQKSDSQHFPIRVSSVSIRG